MRDKIVIDEIKTTKKGLYALFCKGEFLFSADDMTLYRYGIKVGSSFDEEELWEIQREALGRKALEKSYALLRSRRHSERQLRQKLERSFPPPAVDYACEKLLEEGLLDDWRFSLARASYLYEKKGASLGFVLADLRSRGVDSRTARSRAEETRPRDPRQRLALLIEKKYKGELQTPEKIVQSLLRKGFSRSEIRAAFEILRENSTEK